MNDELDDRMASLAAQATAPRTPVAAYRQETYLLAVQINSIDHLALEVDLEKERLLRDWFLSLLRLRVRMEAP